MSIQSSTQPQMGQSSDLGEDFDFVSETSFDLPESRIAPPPPLLAKRRHAEMGYRRALVDQQTQAQSLPLFGLLGSGAGGGGGHGGGYGGGGGCSLSLPNLCQLLALEGAFGEILSRLCFSRHRCVDYPRMSHDVHDAESVAWVHLQKAGHQGLELLGEKAGSEVFRMLCPE